MPLYTLFERPSTLGLHGSAAVVDGRAVVFIGRSGAGKSTTAYELMSRGARLAADDLTVVDVEEELAIGASPTVRLWKGSKDVPEALEDRQVSPRTDKRWFRLEEARCCAEPVALGAVVLLDPDSDESIEEPRLDELCGREALVGLLEQTFDFSNPWREWQIRRFRLAGELVRKAGVFRFSYEKSESGEPTHVDPLVRALEAIE